MTDPTAIPRPAAPDHRDLYLLVAGLAIGLACSQWVLGRFDSATYTRLFLGGQAQRELFMEQANRIADAKARHAKHRERLQGTDTALEAFENEAKRELATLNEELANRQDMVVAHVDAHKAMLNDGMLALALAVLVLMGIETLLLPDSHAPPQRAATNPVAPGAAPPDDVTPRSLSTMRSRLTHLRYVVMAGFLALLVARPELVLSKYLLLPGIVLGVVLTAIAAIKLPRIIPDDGPDQV